MNPEPVVKHLDEYRDKQVVTSLLETIAREVTGRWTIMEICGGQTHSILKYSLQDLLPGEISLIHGPGCPVCVTPVELIDAALELASRDHVILASFGDMLRVPGTKDDLLSIKALGGDIRMLYSPLDALAIAAENPLKEIVFFGVGFETTAPAVALAIREARRRGLKNFSVLVSHVLVPPAMDALLNDDLNRIDGFLAAGHVCTVMGTGEYEPLAGKHRIPVVVTGFEPVDILHGILRVIRMLQEGRYGVENAYSRSVRPEGNRNARALLQEVFEPTDRRWRGIGTIPGSGLGLRAGYSAYDASVRFGLIPGNMEDQSICIAGEILTGKKKPTACHAFGTICTPEKPAGAPMVSSEGACSSYYRFSRQ